MVGFVPKKPGMAYEAITMTILPAKEPEHSIEYSLIVVIKTGCGVNGESCLIGERGLWNF